MGWPGPMTSRQLSAWHEWLSDEWNRPGPEAHYLAQIAMVVERVQAKHPRKFKLQKYLIRFGPKAKLPTIPIKGGPRPFTKEDIERIRKQENLARFGHRPASARGATPAARPRSTKGR